MKERRKKGAPAWVCRRNHRHNPFFSSTRDLQPLHLPLVILNSAPCNPRATHSSLPLMESRSQSPTTAPSHCLLATGPEISQTFLRLNGLKRHTPAHLRAPVRVLSSFNSVIFPFYLVGKGIIKSNAIPRRSSWWSLPSRSRTRRG